MNPLSWNAGGPSPAMSLRVYDGRPLGSYPETDLGEINGDLAEKRCDEEPESTVIDFIFADCE